MHSLTVSGFGLFYVGYDGSSASPTANAYVATLSFVWPIDKERKAGALIAGVTWRLETDAKAGDELPADKKGDAFSRLRASEEPKENEEKREVIKKLKERES